MSHPRSPNHVQAFSSSERQRTLKLVELQALNQAETLKQEGNKLYADDDLEPAVVRPGPLL